MEGSVNWWYWEEAPWEGRVAALLDCILSVQVSVRFFLALILLQMNLVALIFARRYLGETEMRSMHIEILPGALELNRYGYLRRCLKVQEPAHQVDRRAKEISQL